MASLRCLAAATVISRRSLTLACPVNSEKREGRNVISNAASGCVNTSETIRSAMLAEDEARARTSQGKSRFVRVRLKCRSLPWVERGCPQPQRVRIETTKEFWPLPELPELCGCCGWGQPRSTRRSNRTLFDLAACVCAGSLSLLKGRESDQPWRLN